MNYLHNVCESDCRYLTVQIADFGLSRDVSKDDVYVSQGGMIPIKWTAPEVLV